MHFRSSAACFGIGNQRAQFAPIRGFLRKLSPAAATLPPEQKRITLLTNVNPDKFPLRTLRLRPEQVWLCAQAAKQHDVLPRTLGFKGTIQTLEAFQPVIAYLRQRSSTYRQRLYQEILDAISSLLATDPIVSNRARRSGEDRRMTYS